MRLLGLPAALLAMLPLVAFAQLDLNTSSPDSIRAVAKAITKPMVKLYTDYKTIPGVGIPGLLPQPYYWWESGAMFLSLINYWHSTGDTQYNDLVTEALLFQVGPDESYMPPNQTKSLGNDDQAFWGFAVMTAAEFKFQNPPPDRPQWLALAQGVWNSQALRWHTDTCNGGLHWQIFPFNGGYDYKHSPSNGAFLNLGARLYAYTGNETYAKWVKTTWDWMDGVGLLGGQNQLTVFDGTSENDNCTKINHMQWTYNFGMLMNGAAVMWDATGDEIWRTRALGIWNASMVFYHPEDRILREVACEGNINNAPFTCNNDQMSFKAYFIRWAAVSTKWAPWLYDLIEPYIVSTAEAVGRSCDPAEDGAVCGQRWDTGSFYNASGPGQQMCALEAVQALLINDAASPVTANTGGTSKGDPTAGTSGDTSVEGAAPSPSEKLITTADKAGAGVLTAFLIVATLSACYWMVV